MNLRLHLVPRPLTGPVLLVDVWQGSLIGFLLQAGAPTVWVVGSPRLGLLLSRPGDLLLGEQEGLPPEGYTHLASLANLAGLDLANRRAILLAPELAHSLEALQPQDDQEVYLGYFRNARAVVQTLEGLTNLTLLPTSDQGEPGLGQLLAAGFLARRLLAQSDQHHSEGVHLATSLLRAFPDPQEALFQSERGQRLFRMGRTEDIAYSSLISVDNTVPCRVLQQTFTAGTVRTPLHQTAYGFENRLKHDPA